MTWRLKCYNGASKSNNCSNITNLFATNSGLTLGFAKVPSNGWFHSINGDLYASQDTTRLLPLTSYVTNPYLIDSYATFTNSAGIFISPAIINVKDTDTSGGGGGNVKISDGASTDYRNYFAKAAKVRTLIKQDF